MDFRLLIRNGIVVDGSGAPAYAADVRIGGGRITEIGLGLAARPDERIVDATGCYVTPGFIEAHNHWDGAVWWSPNMEPMTSYGITTSINGNCGFSMAPAPGDEQGREDIIEIFNFFEDIPVPPMRKMIPWDWRKWSEYKASFERNVKVPLNFAAFCGHIPLRLVVMGPDAWTRAATPDEIAQMCALLDDALRAGAMGLSTNQLDYDSHDRPLPSMLAEDDEYAALFAVVARHPGATVEVIVDHFMRMTGPETSERLGYLAHKAGARLQWAGLPTLKFQAEPGKRSDALHERFKAEGVDCWTGYTHIAFTFLLNFYRTLFFAQTGNPVWQEMVDVQDEDEKLRMLADPDWRARARASWDGQHARDGAADPNAMMLRESEIGSGPVGITLAQFMTEAGIGHPSDALAEWLLRNGPGSIVLQDPWETDEAVILKLLKDPRSIGNVSDSGAHGKLFCGAGDNVLLLTDYVRDRKLLTIEEAIHVLTGKLADFFGFGDRGLIAVGKAADITVFNLAEIERRPEEKIWDVPDGEGGRTYRYSRAPAPMRLTLCNGVPTFDHGVITGRYPGRFIGPESENRQALAAE
jgi:N-acyl-D-aspartate/D-glutamate deacylase